MSNKSRREMLGRSSQSGYAIRAKRPFGYSCRSDLILSIMFLTPFSSLVSGMKTTIFLPLASALSWSAEYPAGKSTMSKPPCDKAFLIAAENMISLPFPSCRKTTFAPLKVFANKDATICAFCSMGAFRRNTLEVVFKSSYFEENGMTHFTSGNCFESCVISPKCCGYNGPMIICGFVALILAATSANNCALCGSTKP